MLDSDKSIFFRHFNTPAEFIAEDPQAAESWESGGGEPVCLLGYLRRESVFDDEGIRDVRATKLEYQLQTDDITGLCVRRDRTLRIDGVLHRITALSDFSGVTRIQISEASRRKRSEE